MQTRHRIPTIFSIYMVDVLCCALGCVILLWQLYHTESEEQTAAAQAALGKLADAENLAATLRSELQQAGSDKAQLSLELDAALKKLGKAERLALVRLQDFEALKKTHAAAEALLATLKTDLKSITRKSDRTSAELAAKIKALADAETRLATLEKEMKLRDLELRLAAKDAADRKLDLNSVEERSKKLESLLAEMKSQGKDYLAKLSVSDLRIRLLEQELAKNKLALTDSDRRLRDLLASDETIKKKWLISVKDLAAAQALLDQLQSEKKSLLLQASRLRNAAENRFAGIELTGRRIVFLVDTSGSMVMADQKKEAPDKWPLVIASLLKVMKSLPDLQQYQVLLFSDKIRYAMGQPGVWLDWDPDRSPGALEAALKAVRPEGATDMNAALAEAFRFRTAGLDTLYVFSDGLPNAGDGLPADSEQLTEVQKTDTLARFVRNRLRTEWNPPGSPSRIRINTIGFFFESPEVGAFLWALARENDGSFVGMSRP